MTADDAEILDGLDHLIAAESTAGPQRVLLDTALAGLRSTVERLRAADGVVAFIDLPLAVGEAEGGDRAGFLLLARACCLVFLALDIFDDLADGDRPPHWDGWTSAEIMLAAATLLSGLTPLLLAQLPTSDGVRVAVGAALTRGLLRMSAGQQADLQMTGSEAIDPAAVEASVQGKSGEQQAVYARMAGLLAGADPGRIEAYAEVGRCMGTAGQLASDCQELLSDPDARDLSHGTRTLPVALQLHRLDGEARDSFVDLLKRAEIDPKARLQIREQLLSRGIFRRVLVRGEVLRQRARRIAFAIRPGAPLGARMEEFLSR